jgi:hypothetical protein
MTHAEDFAVRLIFSSFLVDQRAIQILTLVSEKASHLVGAIGCSNILTKSFNHHPIFLSES